MVQQELVHVDPTHGASLHLSHPASHSSLLIDSCCRLSCVCVCVSVLDLLHWQDVKSSALVFGSSLFVLLSLTYCSIISVLSYAALALLSVTVTFRIYKGVLQAIQKSDEGHPFK